MKKIRLESLALDVEVWDDVFYHDDGELESISDHAIKLLKKYEEKGLSGKFRTLKRGLSFKLSSKIIGGRVGACFYLPFSGRTNVHICIKKGLSHVEQIFARSHEETHALSYLGKMGVLLNEMEKRGVNTEGFNSLPEETKAHIGSLYNLCLVNAYENPFDLHSSYASEAAEWLIQKGPKNLDLLI